MLTIKKAEVDLPDASKKGTYLELARKQSTG